MDETDHTSESNNPSGEQCAETMADAPEFNDGEKVDDQEALHEQEVIADADVDFAEALSKALPQVGEDGKVNYYICGSMALDLLPRVRKLETFHQQGREGEPESQGEIELPDTARTEFLKGVRKKGHDIDVVRVTGRTGLTIQTQKVLDQCKDPKSIELASEKKHEASFFAFDAVGENQSQQEYSYSKATLDDGEEVYIASPGALIGAQAVDVLGHRSMRPPRANEFIIRIKNLDTPEKIEAYNREAERKKAADLERRMKDLTTLVAGFSKVMSREEIINSAKTAIMHRLREGLEDYDESKREEILEARIKQLEALITECLENV